MCKLKSCSSSVFHCVKALLHQASKNQLSRHMIYLYAFTFLVALPIVSQNFKFSPYFIRPNMKKSQEAMRQENTKRYEQAVGYVKMLNDTKLHQMLGHTLHNETGVDVAISIITVSRNRHSVDSYEPHYLTQVVWKLLHLLHQAQANGFHLHVHVAVCNVDGDAESYKEAQALRSVVPVHNRFKKLYLTIDSQVEKEKQDYIYCMNSSLVHDPRYILLIEDDALPNDDFFTVLQHLIETRMDYRYLGGTLVPNTNPGLYVKLYHPERLLGFINAEPDRIPQLLSFGALFGTVALVLYRKMVPSNEVPLFKLWLCFMIYATLVALAIGRPHLIELKRLFSPHLYNFLPAPECCTPAMLFPKPGALKIMNYLSTVKCKWKFGKDTAIWQWQKQNQMSAFMVQPNLVSHIGLYSALRKVILDPFIV